MLTVITPATSAHLTTLAAVKAELGVSGNAENARLAGYIVQASDMIATYCARVFAKETLAETFRIEHRAGGLLLSRNPVVLLASVVEIGDELATDDYELDRSTGIVYRLNADARALWAPGKIVITYDAGFILPSTDGRTLPQAIERAALMLVSRFYFAAGRDPTIRSESADGMGSMEYFAGLADGMPPDVAAIVDPYRNPAVA